ncbi:MAG: nucleoside hydrolase [Chloroflexota bacterium]|nr:nucleoside hydrolase [Chloroflexota bacterium]
MQHQVIVDTDIATDPDDLLALAVLLGSPEVDLVGITTVHADVEFRARYVQALLQLRGGSKIPIHAGLRHPLMRRMEPYWEGHEGAGMLDDDLELPPLGDVNAVQFLIETVMARRGELTLLALGPLTNVATAMLAEPRLAESLKRLVIMGGIIATHGLGKRVSEHNIWLDPEAAHVVFTTADRVELVPIDVTEQVVIDMAGLEAIRAANTPYHAAVADQTGAYHRFHERGQRTFLHDPLAAVAMLRPDLLDWHDYSVKIELDGSLTRGMTVAFRSERPNAAVAMSVDVEASQALILNRILAGPPIGP